MKSMQITGMPEDLLKEFDESIKGQYNNRSEAVRQLIRRFVERQKAAVEVVNRLPEMREE